MDIDCWRATTISGVGHRQRAIEWKGRKFPKIDNPLACVRACTRVPCRVWFISVIGALSKRVLFEWTVHRGICNVDATAVLVSRAVTPHLRVNARELRGCVRFETSIVAYSWHFPRDPGSRRLWQQGLPAIRSHLRISITSPWPGP